MTEADRPKFLRIVQAMAAVFRTEPSTALFDGYWFALEDLPMAAFEKAAKECLRDSKFMPAPSELREVAQPRTGYLAPYHVPITGYDTCGAHLYNRQPLSDNECRKGKCPLHGQPFVLLTDGRN